MFADTWGDIDWELTLNNVQTILTILAIIAAYFRFVRGRVHHHRLELTISGRAIDRNTALHLLVTVRLKNVGVSQAVIRQEGTALRIYGFEPVPDDTGPASNWKRLDTLSVLTQHEWIESGETIEDQQLIVVPKNYHTFNLELRVVTEGGFLMQLGQNLYQRLKDTRSSLLLWLAKLLPKRTTWKTNALVTREMPSNPSPSPQLTVD